MAAYSLYALHYTHNSDLIEINVTGIHLALTLKSTSKSILNLVLTLTLSLKSLSPVAMLEITHTHL